MCKFTKNFLRIFLCLSMFNMFLIQVDSKKDNRDKKNNTVTRFIKTGEGRICKGYYVHYMKIDGSEIIADFLAENIKKFIYYKKCNENILNNKDISSNKKELLEKLHKGEFLFKNFKIIRESSDSPCKVLFYVDIKDFNNVYDINQDYGEDDDDDNYYRYRNDDDYTDDDCDNYYADDDDNYDDDDDDDDDYSSSYRRRKYRSKYRNRYGRYSNSNYYDDDDDDNDEYYNKLYRKKASKGRKLLGNILSVVGLHDSSIYDTSFEKFIERDLYNNFNDYLEEKIKDGGSINKSIKLMKSGLKEIKETISIIRSEPKLRKSAYKSLLNCLENDLKGKNRQNKPYLWFVVKNLVCRSMSMSRKKSKNLFRELKNPRNYEDHCLKLRSFYMKCIKMYKKLKEKAKKLKFSENNNDSDSKKIKEEILDCAKNISFFDRISVFCKQKTKFKGVIEKTKEEKYDLLD